MLLWRKRPTDVDDSELLARIRKGEREALAQLWDRYAHLLYGVGLKYLKDPARSKDEVVELFASLPGLLARHLVERPRPWLHTVMRNRCLLALRGRQREKSLDETHVPDDSGDDRSERLLHEARLHQLEEAIEKLNDEQRQCIRFFYLERLSYRQVAERTGYALDQVRSHLQNGRRNLKIQLQQHADREY